MPGRRDGSTAALAAALLLAAVMPAMADPDYPRIELDNGYLEVALYLPDAGRGYYRGTRFDWSGIIERVDYAGHRFYAPLHERHDPLGHDHVSGPAGEFAMFHPMGFAEAAAGESFVKIGVGLLARGESDEYRFDEDYRLLRAGDWQVEHDRRQVTFSQHLQGERGWAYRYRKTIRLLPGKPVFEIEQWLENSGDRTIDIEYYNHNFTLIDGHPFGPDYRVEFPFVPRLPETHGELVAVSGNALQLLEPLGERSLWLPLFEGTDPGHFNAAVVRNLRSGAAVEFGSDAPLARMIFWAVERAACPEPFIRIYLEPGQSMDWVTSYAFSADSAGSD